MCGRFSVVQQIRALAKRFKVGLPPPAFDPTYNLAPSQMAPVVINEIQREFKIMQWGLIPAWASDPKIGHKMINARAETIDEKPAFKHQFKTKRCLVVCDGYYEWQATPGRKHKIPYRIGLKSKEPFSMAGIFDKWTNPKGKLDVWTFSIVTTDANMALKDIHPRMPVMLKPQDEDLWLNHDLQDVKKLKSVLKPFPDHLIDSYQISQLVNSPSNNSAKVIEPLPTSERKLQQRNLFN